jgi:hypothetical protein
VVDGCTTIVIPTLLANGARCYFSWGFARDIFNTEEFLLTHVADSLLFKTIGIFSDT